MRFTIATGLLGALLFCSAVGSVRAQPPVGKSPDLYENVTKITKASDEEQKKGILATIEIKGSDIIVRVTKDTQIPISKGKLEEKGMIDDLKVGDRVSVWYMGKVEKSDPARATAYMVMIFRPGQPLPLPPAKEPAPEKNQPGWPGSFIDLGGYALTCEKPIVGEGEKPSTYQQKGVYLWTGGRAEVLEVTLARDPGFKDKYSADALKKEDPLPKELEFNKKKAWLWEFPRETGKIDQLTRRLVILLDTDKAIILEQKGSGASLESVAKKFDFAEIEKALANPPKR